MKKTVLTYCLALAAILAVTRCQKVDDKYIGVFKGHKIGPGPQDLSEILVTIEKAGIFSRKIEVSGDWIMGKFEIDESGQFHSGGCGDGGQSITGKFSGDSLTINKLSGPACSIQIFFRGRRI